MKHYTNPSTTSELLFEVGVEEMPARVIAPAITQLSEIAAKQFASYGIAADRCLTYGTPRRLILHVSHLSRQTETCTETIVGPPQKIAFDASGSPTQAAMGFAKSQGVEVAQLTLLPTAKGPYLAVSKQTAAQPTSLLLPKILPDILSALTFPKTMRWEESGVSFIRPIRWMVALYDKKIVPMTYAGVWAGALSQGHRSLSPGTFRVGGFASYKKALQRRFVLIDPKERYDAILKSIQGVSTEAQGWVDKDEALLWQAVFSVEYPVALRGSFDRDFLKLPPEVITTAMKEHQGYFPLLASDPGAGRPALLPCFVAIINTHANETIRSGNERVLRARLADAKFYYDRDLSITLEQRRDALGKVTYHERLGTLHDKVERLIPLATFIANQLAVSPKEVVRVAELCKSDLLTGVVQEFPSLQGTMGRVYGRIQGESEAVALGIEEHYLPRVSGGALPETPIGQLLAVADKLDTIVGCLGAGLIPSGSEDPYALRRAGLGLVQICTLPLFARFSLKPAIDFVISSYPFLCDAQAGSPKAGFWGVAGSPKAGFFCAKIVLDFLKQRLAFHLASSGFRADIVDAVLSRQADSPYISLRFAQAITQSVDGEEFKVLMTGFKRAARIVPNGFQLVDLVSGDYPPEVSVEHKLYNVLMLSRDLAKQQWDAQRYDALIRQLATLHAPLSDFFDTVMVMDTDEGVRNRRLTLLAHIVSLFDRFADFSKIVA